MKQWPSVTMPEENQLWPNSMRAATPSAASSHLGALRTILLEEVWLMPSHSANAPAEASRDYVKLLKMTGKQESQNWTPGLLNPKPEYFVDTQHAE